VDIHEYEAKSILTPTGGFLFGFSHTLNPYVGCSLGKSLCGMACYAAAMRYASQEMPSWGKMLKIKLNAASLYHRDYGRIRSNLKPIKIFMSSVTDPYVPQERRYRITRSILQAMLDAPPDALVLQTHTPNILWDIKILEQLHKKCCLTVQITVETDQEALPGFPRHAYSVAARLNALGKLTQLGLRTVGVVSPLLPLAKPELFAKSLGQVASLVILDHYLLGDGSRNGLRTRGRKPISNTTVPEMISAADTENWNTLEKFNQVVAIFRTILGDHRIGVSAQGFREMVGCV